MTVLFLWAPFSLCLLVGVVTAIIPPAKSDVRSLGETHINDGLFYEILAVLLVAPY